MTISELDDILFPRVVAWENLLEAYRKAARRKRGKLAAATYEREVADNLLALQGTLTTGMYRRGDISFAELDAGVQGWINHVRYGDTWGLRGRLFGLHPV